jgi:hypothetical protein
MNDKYFSRNSSVSNDGSKFVLLIDFICFSIIAFSDVCSICFSIIAFSDVYSVCFSIIALSDVCSNIWGFSVLFYSFFSSF